MSLVIKIILIILIVRLCVYQIIHLLEIFNDSVNQMAVDQILDDPNKYVRYREMIKFMYNCIWFVLFIKLLIMVFNENLEITFIK